MGWDVAGIGNALMDALVVVDDDALLDELGLTRGTMHPVTHDRWTEVYERVRRLHVSFDSGGSCANTIATVGRLGGRAVYCGQVGDDQMGHLYGSLMEKACGQHALRFTRDAATGKCLAIISKRDAERTMLTDLGAAVGLSSIDGFEPEIQSARVVHFEGYTLLGDPLRAVVTRAMDLVDQAGGLISIDASDPFVILQVKDLFWKILDERAHIVFLNAEEARHLTGAPDAERAIHAIAGRGQLQHVIVKVGAQGSLVWSGGEVYRIAPRRVNAIDTTGAGDAYAGGYLYGVCQGWSADRCGALASSVAALTVSQVGAVVKDADALSRAIVEAV